MKKFIARAFLIVSLLSNAGWAEHKSIMQSDQTSSIELKAVDDSVSVMGSNNKITITGKGDHVWIMGSENQIFIHAQLSRELRLAGKDNKVIVFIKHGHPKPLVKQLATPNVVTFEEEK